MKRILKVLIILVLLIVLAAFILPFVFKDEIIARAKSEINNSLNAQVDFQDIDISLFRSFPDFALTIENTTVDGQGKFEGIRLAEVEEFQVDLNLFSVISGNQYELEAINLSNARIHVLIDSSGAANYDIMKASADTSSTTDTASSSDFQLTLKEYSLNNVHLIYEDHQAEIRSELRGLEHSGTGDFTQDVVDLSTTTRAERLDVSYGGVEYLSRVEARMEADFKFEQEGFKVTFEENLLELNDLGLTFEGWLAMPEDIISMDLSFNAPENQFKNLLSLIPAVYQESFADVQTQGDFLIKGNVKGDYVEEPESYPQFDFKFSVNEASFQYPDLPAGVENIDVDARVYNRSDQLDGTVVEVPKANATIAGNPIVARFSLSKPMSNPTFDAYLKTNMDLSNITTVLPAPGVQASGDLKADISLAGTMNDLEAERYEAVKAEGMLQASQIKISGDSLPYDVAINTLDMSFSPQFVELKAFESTVGRSDFAANGRIENLMGYALNDQSLQANFSLTSELIDLNELSPSEASGETTEKDGETTDTSASALEAVRLPRNLEFTMNTSIATLIYDNLEIKDIEGQVLLKNGRAELQNVSMNLLDGSLVLSGSYNSVPALPKVDMNFKINGFSFKESYQKLVSIRELAPIMQYSTGSYSTGLSFSSNLQQDMTPEFGSVQASGSLSTSNLQTSPKVMSKVASALQNQSLSTLKIGDIDLNFAIENGRVEVEPFNFEAANVDVEVAGTMGLDKTLDYTMDMAIPVNGIKASGLLDKIGATQEGKVNIAVLIGGTFSDPKVKTSVKDLLGSTIDNLKEQAREKVEDAKEKAVEKVNEKASELIAQAEARGDKLIAEAEQQGEKIMSAARNTADRIRREANKNADKLEADAQGNFLKEKAAEKAADKVRSEADKKADQVVAEAQQKVDDLVDQARRKKEQLVEDAREKGQISN